MGLNFREDCVLKSNWPHKDQRTMGDLFSYRKYFKPWSSSFWMKVKCDVQGMKHWSWNHIKRGIKIRGWRMGHLNDHMTLEQDKDFTSLTITHWFKGILNDCIGFRRRMGTWPYETLYIGNKHMDELMWTICILWMMKWIRKSCTMYDFYVVCNSTFISFNQLYMIRNWYFLL